MSKKNKQRAAEVKSRLLSDKDISPFSSVVLKEKKEEPKKKMVNIEKKKPSEIVGGYDANASFADILFSYEHTGNPYQLPSQKRQKEIRENKKTNFGDILDKWEEKQNPTKKTVQHQKSVNKVTKSFEDILAEYDGYKPAPIIKKEKDGKKPISTPKKEVVHQKSVNKVTKDFGSLLSEFNNEKKQEVTLQPVKETKAPIPTQDAPKSNPFFISENEEDKRDQKAVWSIYGDNKPVKREEVKKEEQPKKVEIKKSAPYVPQKDFDEILGEYAHFKAPQKSYEEVKAELKEEVKPDASNRFFISENDEDKRDKNAVWSIYGDNKPVKREEVKKEEQPQKVEIKKSEPYEPTKAFDTILSEYKESQSEPKTFEEIMRQKGDLASFEKKYTINELRTMPPEATLDLHEHTEKEAKDALNAFLKDAKEHKLRKICVIHGKGLHSKDGIGILKSVVELTLRESGMVSESFAPSARYGGSGALWIILKEN